MSGRWLPLPWLMLSACAPQEPAAPTSGAGVTILPVDEPPVGAAEAPIAAPPVTALPHQRCECDGKCEPTLAFVERTTEAELLACEKRRSTKGIAEGDRDQRVLECFFPKTGTRLRLCTIAPAERADFDAYLRSAISLPRPCFDSARARGLGWGLTEVTFRLDGGGYAQDIVVDASDSRLATCIADGLKTTPFASYAGDVTRVRFRFVFDMPR